MPARRTPSSPSAIAYNTPSSSQSTNNYSPPRSTKGKRSPQRNGVSDGEGGGSSSNSPKYTAYLRERSYDDLNDNPFAREEAFLRAMSESDIWASAFAPRSGSGSVYSDDGNDVNPFISNINGDNTIGSRDINNPGGTSPNGSPSWWNPFKPLINSLAFLLNVIGSTFFYIYWGIRESLNFIWRNLTGDANGPFMVTIAGVDPNAPPIPPASIATTTAATTTTTTVVSRNNKLFWLLMILLAALLTLFTLSLFESPLIDKYLPQLRSPIKIQLWPVNNTTYWIQAAGESEDGSSDVAKGGKEDSGGILFTMDDLKKLIAAEVRNSCTKNGADAPSIGPSSDHLRGLISTEVKSICSHEVKKELLAQRAETPRLRGKFTAEDMMDLIRKEARKIVSEELLVFSQDKLNLPDFALHSGGAKVMSKLTSKTYEVWPEKWYSRLFAYISGGQGVMRGKPPVTAISPDTYVGQCWPFQGQNGQLAIWLNRRVHVNAVTYDHVSKDVAVEVLSAPKDFEVWGIVDDGTMGKGEPMTSNELGEVEDELFFESTEEECGVREDGQYVSDRENNAHASSQNANSKALSDLDPSLENMTSGNKKFGSSPLHFFLGEFTYDINGLPVQTFEVPPDILKHNKPIRTIIMVVKSNWGEPSYTCLYRFRVHGEPAANRIINNTEKES